MYPSYACFIGRTILFISYTFVMYDDVLQDIIFKMKCFASKYPSTYFRLIEE